MAGSAKRVSKFCGFEDWYRVSKSFTPLFLNIRRFEAAAAGSAAGALLLELRSTTSLCAPPARALHLPPSGGMKVLVVGGSGYLGQFVVEDLAKSHEVPLPPAGLATRETQSMQWNLAFL